VSDQVLLQTVIDSLLRRASILYLFRVTGVCPLNPSLSSGVVVST
jgi:hypothetical protein